MEMPTPGKEHDRLTAFVGRWQGEETLFPSAFSPLERSAVGQFHYRMAMGGFFLLSDYEELVANEPSYGGHGVYGYDEKEGCFTMHWFDSMGGSYLKPATGGWDGNSLVFQNMSEQGHARYTHTIEPEDYSFKIEISDDGEAWSMFMLGDYRRL